MIFSVEKTRVLVDAILKTLKYIYLSFAPASHKIQMIPKEMIMGEINKSHVSFSLCV